MNRRNFMMTTGAIGLMAAMPTLTLAQEIGSLEIFVPAAPGGGWDQTARVMDQILRGEGLIGSARITNVGGAGGTIGLPQFINQYSGEGNALMTGGMVMIGAIITNNAPVDLTMVTPIARLTGEYLTIVVPAASDIQTMEDLVAKLKADPGSVSWAGGSAGGSDHMLAGLVAQAAGVDPLALSYVAFAGGGEAMAALLGNQVTCGVSGWGEFSEQVGAGNLRVIGISAPERVEGIDAPTIREQGLDVELLNWRGVFAPPAISDEDRARLIDMLTRMDASEAWQAELASRSWDRLFLAGDDFAAYLAEDTDRIRSVLQGLGLAAG
ncbi:tripartite tricarboxylate transporter substrate-binding protein [Paracoccus sp. PS-1]|uniref:Bug family tripartite tricarboxylate transporter substrate binding protein n=1 Tax=unclassified Paracoccus (in: a-proteobacteria) TaxID=2688777 RepID=UPI0004AE5118|nr:MULTISPECIES: tripartite tricarboxylate transporter substrate-binding protein [unclassified Paracoccus (in: a-proteobacteria)]MDQ7262640.1 tripartite tricarboxylate transporter substrate-binding protein [Paracoccus sp. PS1]